MVGAVASVKFIKDPLTGAMMPVDSSLDNQGKVATTSPILEIRPFGYNKYQEKLLNRSTGSGELCKSLSTSDMPSRFDDIFVSTMPPHRSLTPPAVVSPNPREVPPPVSFLFQLLASFPSILFHALFLSFFLSFFGIEPI